MAASTLLGVNGTLPPGRGESAETPQTSEETDTAQWQLSGSGAASYERFQVPSVFEPLARIFLGRIPLRSGQRVLDVACGTGIVGRLAARLIGPSGKVIGVDLNAGMLAVAKQQQVANGALMEWRQGDAAALPCDDATIDVALCQQGLQFFPDKLRALREMHRTLVPGGMVGLCVWRSIEYSPCNVAVAGAVARHVGEEVAQQLHAPFSLGRAEDLHRLVRAAGFREVEISEAEVIRRMLPPEQSIPGHLASTPLAAEIAALDEIRRQALVADVSNLLQPFCENDGMAVPQGTHIVLARK